jgi:hypothetical protein
MLLVLSIILAVVSLFPVATGERQSTVIINDSFNLSPNETRRQGLGSFHGKEQNISVLVESQIAFLKNFSIVTYSGVLYSNYSNVDIAFTFPAGADYYEAVFFSNASNAGMVHFEVSVEHAEVTFPFSWLTTPAKIMFLISLGLVMLCVLRLVLAKQTFSFNGAPLVLSQTGRRRLRALVLLSLAVWLVLLAVNSTPLATFENWYTDHARHSYVSSLFFKDGFSVFDQSLGQLASQDNSPVKFVTWPEMPHVYPLGSILLFSPFGALLQNGVDAVVVYKLEIALFLVIAHVCLYFFLNSYWKKDMNMLLKLVGVYIIYVTLIIYAANGMFDSVPFLFAILALTMFLTERYDLFFLLIAVSLFFKYQTGIFLAPLIVVAFLKLYDKNQLSGLLRNKPVLGGTAFMVASGVTACLSAPFLMNTRPELVMNGINAFSSNTQISWSLQSSSVLLALAITLLYVLYMLNKNSLLAFSALFLLLPSFMLPYFQNWYLPFIFIYVLIPQQKKELEATVIWLIFMIFVLSFGGAAFNPFSLFEHFQYMLRHVIFNFCLII